MSDVKARVWLPQVSVACAPASLFAKGVDNRDSRWAVNDDEQTGEDEEHEWNHDANRDLLRLFLGALTPLGAHFLALDPQHSTNGDTQTVRLHHGHAEGLQVIKRGAFGHCSHCGGSPHANLH